MDIWQEGKLVLFLTMFVPGFISMKVWDLLVPSERRDFGKSLVEAVAFSAINFALLFWLVDYLNTPKLVSRSPLLYYVGNFALFFLFPVVWPIALLRLMQWQFVAKHVIHPVLKPWDYFFGKREPSWVIVYLKNGWVIGGKFDAKSFASSYPAKEQIYIEELWQLDAKRNFVAPIKRSKGAIVLGDDILAIEFFQ
jgi:hypothetical protein